jgi:hypothetical protein
MGREDWKVIIGLVRPSQPTVNLVDYNLAWKNLTTECSEENINSKLEKLLSEIEKSYSKIISKQVRP